MMISCSKPSIVLTVENVYLFYVAASVYLYICICIYYYIYMFNTYIIIYICLCIYIYIILCVFGVDDVRSAYVYINISEARIYILIYPYMHSYI